MKKAFRAEIMGDFRPEIKAVLDETLLLIPGVTAGKMFGYPGYKINGKAFSFVGGDGMSLKLPQERVQALLEESPAMRPFEPVEGTIWREWVAIIHDDASEYAQYEALFIESVQFVAG